MTPGLPPSTDLEMDDKATGLDWLFQEIQPHTHYRGKAFRYELVHEDKREEIMFGLFEWVPVEGKQAEGVADATGG